MMRALSFRPIDKKLRVEGDAALGFGIEFHHPAINSLGIELRVDGAVKRIGEINPATEAAAADWRRNTSQSKTV